MTSTSSAAATGLPNRQRRRKRSSRIGSSFSRDFIEETIETLIDLLDRFEPDPDLEENGDLEPWLAGAPSNDQVALDAELDESETGIGDLDGLWEQGHLAGRGLELLDEERREARAAAGRAMDLVALLQDREAAAEVRS